MDKNHKPCPFCGKPMNRQSPRCHDCAMADPVVRSYLSRVRIGQPSYYRTDDHKKRMSLRLSGRKKTYPTGGSLPGVAEKIRSWWTQERREIARQRGLVLAADPQWRQKIGESVSGEKSGTWENGRAQIPYAPGWGRVNRRLVWKKQNGLCQNCGERKRLDTHHKDGSKSNHAEDNLVGLCRKCHKKAHAELKQRRKNHLC